MGVHVGGRPVRGPAGVSDGGRRGRHRVTFHAFDEIGEPSGLLAHHCMPHARSDERHSRRVVPAVFQALQSLKTHLRGLAARGRNITCISDDSAHGLTA